MAKTFEEYVQEAKKQTDASRNRDIAAINSSADSSVNLAYDTYNQLVEDTNVAYESEYQKNAVQKLINEKQVAEKMANLGLTDSGLNRTQQTAMQMSYANQKGKLDIAKQQALDKLSSDLASYVTGINNQREADKLGVNQFYDQQNNKIATEMYNTDVNAGVELQKAAIEAAGKGNNKMPIWYFTDTYDEDDNPIFRNSEGDTQSFGDGINPYTSDNNKKYVITDKNGNIVIKDSSVLKVKGTDTQKAAAYYGVCSNGYQPNGVIIDGKTQGTIKAYDTIPVGNQITGKKQNVWYTEESGKYWIWYGEGNTYVEVKLINGNWTVI